MFVDPRVIILLDTDVLCERGERSNRHPGNIDYRDICNLYKPAYQAIKGSKATADAKKNLIAKEIFKQLEGQYVRFLQENNRGFYELLPEHEILKKIKQYLRTPTKSKKKTADSPVQQDVQVAAHSPFSPNHSAGVDQVPEAASLNWIANPSSSRQSMQGIQITAVEGTNVVTEDSSSADHSVRGGQQDPEGVDASSCSSHTTQGNHIVAVDTMTIDAVHPSPIGHFIPVEQIPEQFPDDNYSISSSLEDLDKGFDVDSFLSSMEPDSQPIWYNHGCNGQFL